MKFGNLEIKVPIIQGGMGIRVSMSKLASAVANQGGIGVISGTAIPDDELKNEIRKAKEKIVEKGGALGVNIMVAAKNFFDALEVCVKEKIDILIFGAGFSRDAFEICKKASIKVFPIVSSLKLAKIAEKLGADAIIVEGGNAGGHLGTDKDSWDIVEEIAKGVKIPVFAAGGVMLPEDAKRMLELGASGVQMGSRFVASEECEVSDQFKDLYVKSGKEDMVQIMSSVGLPANAIRTKKSEELMDKDEKFKIDKCVNCLNKCDRRFCVRDTLIKGHSGDMEEGVFFAGKEIWKIKEVLSVEEIFKRFKPVFE